MNHLSGFGVNQELETIFVQPVKLAIRRRHSALCLCRTRKEFFAAHNPWHPGVKIVGNIQPRTLVL